MDPSLGSMLQQMKASLISLVDSANAKSGSVEPVVRFVLGAGPGSLSGTKLVKSRASRRQIGLSRGWTEPVAASQIREAIRGHRASLHDT